MTENNFSAEKSLALIHDMIGKARQNMSDNSIYFLVWGWGAFLACAAQFVLKNVYHYEKHYLVWLVVIPCIVFSIVQGRKEDLKVRAKTYVDESIRHLWSGMAISFFVLGMILTRLGWQSVIFPFFIMLYGLGTFVSGKIIRFSPLIYGGVIASVLAIASTWANYDYQILFGAAALLVSYIIPAHLLKAQFKKQNQLS